jgi:hypothetical protein
MLVAAAALAAAGAHAQVAWRTPPVKNTGTTEVVSCDLLNNSGHDILVSNLTIRVQTLDRDLSSMVVHTPGAMLMGDGKGIRGSSPAGALPFRTVYCEVDLASSISVGDDALMFTMTFDDGTRKVVTTAPPRPPRIAR